MFHICAELWKMIQTNHGSTVWPVTTTQWSRNVDNSSVKGLKLFYLHLSFSICDMSGTVTWPVALAQHLKCHIIYFLLLYFIVYVFPCSANGSDSKKQRLDESPPSRVLHIRKLPNEVSETEVIALGLPFGKVTNILMLKGKNQVNYNIQNSLLYSSLR